MGNANTHVNERERRKSRDGGGGASSHLSSSSDQQLGSAISASFRPHHQQHHHPRSGGGGGGGGNAARYDDVGPVEMTADVHRNSHASSAQHRSKSGSVSAASQQQQQQQQQQPYRPRATTEVGRGSRGRQISLDHSSNFESLQDPASNGSSAGAKERPRKGMPTIFKYPGNAKEVYVCGSFNNWEKLRMNRSAKDFSTLVHLEEGDYEYKFFVDGQWQNDAYGSDLSETKEGFRNNLLRVRKEDFNAFDALDMDSEAVLNSKNSVRVPADFGQEMPPSSFAERSGPPILPPHLLQVILNKDTPLSCEPTLLPEPNHVMLNHLYALSIKEGVMVLSSTQRYRKKYVTTLLYKPMAARKEV